MNGLTFKYVPKDVFGKMVRELTLGLYSTNATISDGTILGDVSTDIYGNECFATEYQNYYLFSDVIANTYKLIKSGAGVLTEILEAAFDVPYSGKATGSDIPYKDNTNVSIADKLDTLENDIEVIEQNGATAYDITVNGKGSYLTIQSAITDSTTGDFIYIKKGEYSENLVVKDGIHIHMEDGVIVTSPTDARALYGYNLTNFKLSGNGRFVNNGINPAIELYGEYNEFKRLNPFNTLISLNSNKCLIYSDIGDNNFYLTADGINFESCENYEVPTGLKTIGKDGTDKVFGFKNVVDEKPYYQLYMVDTLGFTTSTYSFSDSKIIVPGASIVNTSTGAVLPNGTYTFDELKDFWVIWETVINTDTGEFYPSSFTISDDGVEFEIDTDIYDGQSTTEGQLEIFFQMGSNKKGFYYSDDNGISWTNNNTGLTILGTELGKGLYHTSTGKLLIGCNNTIYINTTSNGTWASLSTGLGSGVLQYIVSIGNYVYACIGNTIYRCDITQSSPTWSAFNAGISSATLTFLESNGSNRLYTWDSVAKKLYQCKVDETSTWTEITFPASPTANGAVLNDLIYYNNYLYCNFTKFGILRTYDPSGTTGLYVRYSKWESFNKGLGISSFDSLALIYKSDNYFYYYGGDTQKPLRIHNGLEWGLIKGGSNITLEFDSAENLGYLNSPNLSSPVVSIYYANLNLNCREIYSKRNVGLALGYLYGTINAKIGRIETGVPGMLNGESGSTALLTRCDGFIEIDEIIINNVGHTISPREGIMNFHIKNQISTLNHPTYQVQAVSQITGQATVGTTSTLVFDEIIVNIGKYNNVAGIEHSIGYLTVKGNVIKSSSAVISANGELDMQVDTIENIGGWTAFQSNPQYPYYHYVKNTSFKSQIYLTAIFYKDRVIGDDSYSGIIENCTFSCKSNPSVGQILLLNSPHVDFTPQEGTIEIKGIVTFKHNPNSLITFTGEGIVAVDGNIMNYGKYVYLVGANGIAGSWRMKATLSGGVTYEYTADGINWFVQLTIPKNINDYYYLVTQTGEKLITQDNDYLVTQNLDI